MQQKLGEDYEAREKVSVDAAKRAIKDSGIKLSSREIMNGFFADLYTSPVYPNHYAFSTCDSVGSKLMLSHASIQHPQLSDLLQKQRIASIAGKFDTVAIDGVAMNVNDAAPWMTAFFDQLMKFTACQAAYEENGIAGDVESGLVKAMQMADVSRILNVPKINLGKCETASLEETITTVDETHGFELVFSGFGFIRKNNVLQKGFFDDEGKFHFNIKPGQVILGLESSGLHSNGYTAARLRLLDGSFEKRKKYAKEYTGHYKLDDKVPGYNGKTMLEVLLEPTIIYSKAAASIGKEFPYTVGFNITGNGLANLNRAGERIKYVIDDPIEPHPIFRIFEDAVEGQFRDGHIPENARYDTKKLYHKLNMGMGFAIVVNKGDADRAKSIAESYGIKAKVVGHVEKDNNPKLKTELHLPGKDPIIFGGYM